MLHLGQMLLVLQAAYFSLTSSSITKLSPCACKYNGHIYNLSSLAKKDGARFQVSSRLYEYGYNPCIPFTQGDTQECKNVAICYWSDNGQRHDGIGFQDDVSCEINKGVVELIYKQRGAGRNRMISTVQLKCNEKKILVGEAEMDVSRDAAEPIFVVEHKCCCPDGCPGNVPPYPSTVPPSTVTPPTVPPSTVIPTTVPPFTVPPFTVPPFTVPPPYSSSSATTITWIAIAAAVVFIVIFMISIALCLKRATLSGLPDIVRTQPPPRERLLFPVIFNNQSRASLSREDEDRPPDYGAVRIPLTPPPPYDDDDRDDDRDDADEAIREGVEHEETPSDPRETLSFSVPEDGGFTSPVQVSEQKSK